MNGLSPEKNQYVLVTVDLRDGSHFDKDYYFLVFVVTDISWMLSKRQSNPTLKPALLSTLYPKIFVLPKIL